MKIFLSVSIQENVDLHEEWWRKAPQLLQDYDIVHAISSLDKEDFFKPNEIVRRNEMLQKDCDILLAEYNTGNKNHIGVDYELVRALDWHQPAIVWAHKEYHNRIYLRYLATAILPTLEEAMGYIVSFYPPTNKRK